MVGHTLEYLFYGLVTVMIGWFSPRIIMAERWTNRQKTVFGAVVTATLFIVFGAFRLTTGRDVVDVAETMILCPLYTFAYCSHSPPAAPSTRSSEPLPSRDARSGMTIEATAFDSTQLKNQEKAVIAVIEAAYKPYLDPRIRIPPLEDAMPWSMAMRAVLLRVRDCELKRRVAIFDADPFTGAQDTITITNFAISVPEAPWGGKAEAEVKFDSGGGAGSGFQVDTVKTNFHMVFEGGQWKADDMWWFAGNTLISLRKMAESGLKSDCAP